MWCGKSSYELRLFPNLPYFLAVVCFLEMVAYYSDYSSNHSSNCSDYSGFLSNLGLDFDSDSGTCSDTYCLHIVLVVLDSVDSHTEPALLASAPIENP